MYIDKNRNKVWKNSKGQYHRLDGPAIEWSNEDKNWYEERKLHRICILPLKEENGYKTWCISDIFLEKEQFNNWTIRIKVLYDNRD